MARIWVVEHSGRSGVWHTALAPQNPTSLKLVAYDYRREAHGAMMERAAQTPGLKWRVASYVRVERIAAKKGRK